MTDQGKEVESVPALEQREAEARIAKLNVERRILSLQLSRKYEQREWLKVLAGLGGLFAAFAAIASFSFSAFRWQQESIDARQVRIEERLDQALVRLGSDSASTRLSGIVSLKSFLTDDNCERHPRVLLALTHDLASERELINRSAIIEVLDGIDSKVVANSTLNEALQSLVRFNRTFLRDGKLNQTRSPTNIQPKVDSVEAQTQGLAMAMTALFRKGARVKDLSGIYCVRCDLSNLDLKETNFDDAVLEDADFYNATLVDASFDHADLEGASFVQADLRRAKLIISQQVARTKASTKTREFNTLDSWQKLDGPLGNQVDSSSFSRRFPNFACADLREADFSHRTLGIYVHYWNGSPYGAANFTRANIEKTNFEESKFIVVNTDRDFFEKSKSINGETSKWFKINNDVKDFQPLDGLYFIHIIDGTVLIKDSDFSTEMNRTEGLPDILKYGWAGSNWQQARFSEGIKDWMSKLAQRNDSMFENCVPRTP